MTAIVCCRLIQIERNPGEAMKYAHSLEQASEYAGMAISLMEDRRIAPQPNNFSIWYTYFSGDSPELKITMDLLLDFDQEFTDEQNASVFQKFCSSPYEAVPSHLIAQKMEVELAAVMATLEQAGQNAADYGQTLETASGDLSRIKRTEDLKAVIGNVLTQTHAMVEKSAEVEQRLKESAAEISTLKHELESARQEAMTDALTGLANRKMFDFKLREATQEAMDSGNPVCLLILDLDQFKQVNDTYGHHIGDQVIKLMGTILKDTLKGQDTAARYGGEEFAVILPRTQIANAIKLADNIRQKLSKKEMINRKTGERLGSITVSIGVAVFDFMEQPKDLIERADRALYAAKNGGRNRVVSEHDLKVRKLAISG
jgi:diguanylate cyclase